MDPAETSPLSILFSIRRHLTSDGIHRKEQAYRNGDPITIMYVPETDEAVKTIVASFLF